MLFFKEFFKDFTIEEIVTYELGTVLSSFELDRDFIIYFDLNSEDNCHLNSFVVENSKMLKSKFKVFGKNFIHFPSLTSGLNTIDVLISFYIPQININTAVNRFANTLNEKINCSKKLLDYLGYDGSISSGFVFCINDKLCIVECDDLQFFNLNLRPFDRLLEYFNIQKQKKEVSNYHFSSREFAPRVDPYDNLDLDTIARIEQIQIQLKELKESGQILFALPVLKELLKEVGDGTIVSTLSKVEITNDYRIVLPKFNHLEIELSHLTKVVYLLFLNHPKGINIKELSSYRSELKDLYSKISNQLDHDKMMKSIDDLIAPKSKAIYSHISRIKSAFYKQIDSHYAIHYVVTSSNFGSDIKRIPIVDHL